MSRVVASLLAVLAIQCGLVAIVYWPGGGSQTLPPAPMAAFDRTLVDEIYIGDEFDNETVLRKSGDRWSLPELENLPADTAMVDKLLDAIAVTESRWPVADSIPARQRFQVASYYYQRRISLLANNETLGSIFLGSSPGFRRVYARNESQDAIYAIPFNNHDAPGTSGSWVDRKLLQIRTPVRITADTYSLQRQGLDWQSGIGQPPDNRELEALLAALRSLQIDGLAGEDTQRDLAEAEADLLLSVESLAGKVTLELFSQGDKYFIHSSEYPVFFTISAYDYDRLMTIDARLISGEDHTG